MSVVEHGTEQYEAGDFDSAGVRGSLYFKEPMCRFLSENLGVSLCT